LNPIKQRLKQLRKQEGLTMLEFSKRIEVSAGNVGDWESETRSSVPGANTLVAIAEAFNISLDWLLLGKQAETNQNKREQANGTLHTTRLEQFVAATKNEEYRKLMETALTLSQADLELLLEIALRFNGEEHNVSRLGRAN